MFDRLQSIVERRPVLLRSYLFVRQQYHHLQAAAAYFASQLTGARAAKRFVLFGRGRSGTTALVSMLDALPGVRCEGEILRNCVPFPLLHVLGRSSRVRGKVYGCKILSYQIRDVQWALSAPIDVLRTLHHEHDFRVLYLRRTNLLRHALSNIRARREGFQRAKGDDDTESAAMRVDPDCVLEWIRSSEALRAYEHRLLEGVPHLSLTYEENIRDPSRHQDTVDDICEFLGIESAPTQSRYQKMAPPSLRVGVSNYDQLAARLEGTDYEQFLK